jgi:aminopeptidase N
MKILNVLILVLPIVAISQRLQPEDEGMLSESEGKRARYMMQKMAEPMGTRSSIDMSYYKLDFSINPGTQTIRGVVTAVGFVRDDSASAINYDLSTTMNVDSAFIDGSKSIVSRSGSTIQLLSSHGYRNGDRFETKIYYNGILQSTGLGSIGFNTIGDGSAWYWSLSEPYGARDWWPCNDHPMDKADSVDIWVTVDSTMKVASQGLLTVVNNGNGTRTWKWKHRYPIATYLVSFTVARFDVFSSWFKYTQTDSMEIVNYVTPSLPSGQRAAAGLTPRMLSFFSDKFGLYPFIKEKYGHAEFGWGGGMEHQTITSLYASAFNEGTIAHELSHQWFGDMITCRTWPDLWLNEGFATYCDGLNRENFYGASALSTFLSSKQNSAKAATGSLFVEDTANVNNLFASSRVYNKGAWVLHMLRQQIGDSLFFKIMKTYATDTSVMYKTASTMDFRGACEKVSGLALGPFFTSWVYGYGYPHYTYVWNVVPDTDGTGFIVTMMLSQTSGATVPTFFPLSIQIQFSAAGQDTLVVIKNDRQDQFFSFVFPFSPDYTLLDPRNAILKDARDFYVGTSRDLSIPVSITLEQNYPNPFNASTVIRFTLPSRSHVRIEVFSVVGSSIAVLEEGACDAGITRRIWNPKNVPSGVYFCKLTATSIDQSAPLFSGVVKLMYLK